MGPGLSRPSGAATAGAPPTPLARLARALLLGLVGPAALAVPWLVSAGAGPEGAQAVDAVRYLAWLAIAAPAAGYLAGAQGVGLVPFGLVAPGCWWLVLAAVEAASPTGGVLGTPFHGALAVSGLFAGGLGLGAWTRARAGSRSGAGAAAEHGGGWAGAGVLLLLAGLLAGFPGRGGAPGPPLEPGLARALLDLSPATLVLESAGVDWMRDPAVYDPVASDRFQRLPYRGALAGPLVLLVGCALAFAAELRLRRARRSRS